MKLFCLPMPRVSLFESSSSRAATETGNASGAPGVASPPPKASVGTMEVMLRKLNPKTREPRQDPAILMDKFLSDTANTLGTLLPEQAFHFGKDFISPKLASMLDKNPSLLREIFQYDDVKDHFLDMEESALPSSKDLPQKARDFKQQKNRAFLDDGEIKKSMSGELRTLLLKESSYPLVSRLSEYYPGHDTLLSRRLNALDAHPDVMAILDRSPELVQELCNFPNVLTTVLRRLPAHPIGEDLLRREIDLVNKAEALRQRLFPFRMQLEKTDEPRGFISQLRGGNNEVSVLASKCPTAKDLREFLTQVADRNLVVLALIGDDEFKRGRQHYFQTGAGEHVHEDAEGKITWTVSVNKNERKEEGDGPDVSVYELNIKLGAQDEGKKAIVIQCGSWPDGETIPLHHVERLLGKVDEYVGQSGRGPRATDGKDAGTARWLVHCKQGLERTIVLASINAIREAAESGSKRPVQDIMENMIEDRGPDVVTHLHQMSMIVDYALAHDHPIWKTEGESAA